MAKKVGITNRKSVVKLTRQGGRRPKFAGMNKSAKRNFKPYQGQGR